MKFSVRSGGAGWLCKMDIEILSGPYPMTIKKGNPDSPNFWDREDRKVPGPQLEAVLDYCKALHDSFDADDGDHYADYGAHHDLYGDAIISHNYKLIPPEVSEVKGKKSPLPSDHVQATEQKPVQNTVCYYVGLVSDILC